MHASVRSTTFRLTIIATVLAALAIAVPASMASAPTTVSTAKNSKLGTILVNAHGATLYMFSKNTACTGSCAAVWKPLLGGSAVGKNGAKSSLISLTTIAGGNKQVTYNHHVLYTYVGDKAAGQANGENKSEFGGKWYAVNTAGSEVSGGSGDCDPVCGHY